MIKTIVFDPLTIERDPYAKEFLGLLQKKGICSASLGEKGHPHKNLLDFLMSSEDPMRIGLYGLVKIMPEKQLVVCADFVDCMSLREKGVQAYFLDSLREHQREKMRYKINLLCELTSYF